MVGAIDLIAHIEILMLQLVFVIGKGLITLGVRLITDFEGGIGILVLWGPL